MEEPCPILIIDRTSLATNIMNSTARVFGLQSQYSVDHNTDAISGLRGQGRKEAIARITVLEGGVGTKRMHLLPLEQDSKRRVVTFYRHLGTMVTWSSGLGLGIVD